MGATGHHMSMGGAEAAMPVLSVTPDSSKEPAP